MISTIKIASGVIAALIGAGGFLPYFRDMFSRKTQPHIYTWLVWVLTQGTAAVAVWYGGGSWGALDLTFATLFVAGVFLFSFKYGTKNITKSDTIVLVAALCAILVWWQLNNPSLSVIMVSVIDVVGYVPTLRKSYQEPWSETLVAWVAGTVANVFAVIALSEYNLLTMTYLISITFANLVLISLCFFRRKLVPRPQSIVKP